MKKSFLFHYNTYFEEVEKIKEKFKLEIKEKEKKTDYLYDFINRYCEKVIKKENL